MVSSNKIEDFEMKTLIGHHTASSKAYDPPALIGYDGAI